jgi:hypothetical protein
MILHTVAFKLKHPTGSAAEQDFLSAARALVSIPGVNHFECLPQVSAKNPFAFGIFMEFADQAAYEGYNSHPEHVRFVQDRWVAEVDSFLEADYFTS